VGHLGQRDNSRFRTVQKNVEIYSYTYIIRAGEAVFIDSINKAFIRNKDRPCSCSSSFTSHMEQCLTYIQKFRTKACYERFRILYKSRYNIVSIATGYGLDGWGGGVWVPVEARFSSSPRRPDRFWGPPSLLSNGYPLALSPGVKLPGHKAVHSPPSSVDVQNTWICISIPYAFMV
jgi:hypothetical protein